MGVACGWLKTLGHTQGPWWAAAWTVTQALALCTRETHTFFHRVQKWVIRWMSKWMNQYYSYRENMPLLMTTLVKDSKTFLLLKRSLPCSPTACVITIEERNHWMTKFHEILILGGKRLEKVILGGKNNNKGVKVRKGHVRVKDRRPIWLKPSVLLKTMRRKVVEGMTLMDGGSSTLEIQDMPFTFVSSVLCPELNSIEYELHKCLLNEWMNNWVDGWING